MKGRAAIVWVLTVVACASPPRSPSPAPNPLAPGEGRINVVGGWLWYRVVGSGSGTPLLVVPGLPAASSDYLAPLEALADERPVVFFDPLEGGRSAVPGHAHLLTIERFAGHLADIRSSLGLARVHVFAHSWGTVFAVEHALAQPEGIRSLILASPLLDVARFNDDADRLAADFPVELRNALAQYDRFNVNPSLVLEAGQRFDRLHYCRVSPSPSPLQRSLNLMGWSHGAMIGTASLYFGGMLAGYDSTQRLGSLSIPSLLTCGRHDIVPPETAEAYRALMPQARLVVFEESAHLQMLEETERYVEVLRSFLREVEGG